MMKYFILLSLFMVISCDPLQKFDRPVNDEDSFSDVDGEQVPDLDSDEISDETGDADSDESVPCGSVYFNGVDSYISVEHDDALNLGSTWTIEAWVMQDDTENQAPLIRKGDMSDLPSYWLYGKSKIDSSIYTNTPNGGYQYGEISAADVWLHSSKKVENMKWYHVALVKSETELKLFVDGAFQSAQPSDSNMINNSQNLYFGVRPNNNPLYFSGLIDEIRFSSIPRYSVNFTPEKRFSADEQTIAVWHFEEKEGTETISEGKNILKGVFNGSVQFVNECAENEKECVNECFFEGETQCSEGILKTCEKNDDGCYVFTKQEECVTTVCANNLSCAEDKCPFPGMSQCSEGKISVCIALSDGVFDWTEPEECSGKACADEFICLSCENECDDLREIKCMDGKSFVCSVDSCLKWKEKKACVYGTCKNSILCSAGGWRSVATSYKKCAVNLFGHLYCWENNSEVKRIGLRNDWEAVFSNSFYHICAIAGKELFCVGENDSGQLGIGTTESKETFEKVVSGKSWVFADTFEKSTCAITTLGELFCWGQGMTQPLRIGDKSDWEKTSGLCAISNGELFCRDSIFGEMIKIGTLSNWTAISAGNSICGIAGGELFCKGKNNYGQIGDGTFEDRSDFVKIGERNDWNKIKSDYSSTCGIAGGELYCWGYNILGQLGSGTFETINVPSKVGSKINWTDVSINNIQSCAISAYDIYCWGILDWNTINESKKEEFLLRKESTDLNNLTSVSCGNGHICVISDNELFCWKDNSSGQCAFDPIDAFSQTSLPQKIGFKPDWDVVSAGFKHTCAISKGELFCWGNNEYGQLGNGTTTSAATPSKVSNRNDWSYISSGETYSCGIADRELFCWGSNESGQLGDGTSDSRGLPVKIGNIDKWETVSARTTHTCAITEGKLFCWGNNLKGALGINSFVSADTPVQVGDKNNWTAVETGFHSTCAIADGELLCWGEVLEKIAGETYLSGFQSKPLKISEHSDFSSVSMNLLAIYALRENGDIYIWHGDMVYESESIYFPEKIDGLSFKSLGVNRSDAIMCAISNNDEIYSNDNHYWRNTPYLVTPIPVRIINP